MQQERTNLEIIAPTIDEAIEQGLDQLGLPKDAVEIEILDSGSKGLLGLGHRQARVRLTIRDEEPSPVTRKVDKPAQETSGKSQAKPAAVKADNKEAKPKAQKEISLGDDHELQVAKAVVEEMLDKLKVFAKVDVKYLDSEERNGERTIFIEITGEDLSILIGRKSEILNALQYLCSLIVCRELGNWVPLMIDIQGYRSRRESQLRRIADRMADQAILTGKKQVLEPMPAGERRIIHIQLKDHPDVITESVGDEPNRKVTISLKK
ncbi:MAG: protein jag [Anaerolineaceae bacterium]|nr:protein jag [Anaerolineaceae bacterium]